MIPGRRFDPGKIYATQKTENSKLHGFEVHRPSSKGFKLLLQSMKAIINQAQVDGGELASELVKDTEGSFDIHV